MKLLFPLKKNILLLSVLMMVFLSACTKKTETEEIKEEVFSEDTIFLQVKEVTPEELFHDQVLEWKQKGGTVAVLFGYGFNGEDFLSTVYRKLINRYGIHSADGILYPLFYPDDFKKGNNAHISELYSKLKDKKLKGLIILGAPENTCTALARLQDSYGGKLPFPVISFFPQDNVLGMESTCDFILENKRTAEEETASLEVAQTIDREMYSMLDNAFLFLEQLSEPLKKDTSIYSAAQQVAGNKKRLSRFIDSETNLPSVNHFVMEDIE